MLFKLDMARTKEDAQVTIVLLGLALGLTALLFWRQKSVDGFQTIPTAPEIKADGIIIDSSLGRITLGIDKSTDSDKIKRIIDQQTKTEVWSAGMPPSTLSDRKTYVIIYSEPRSITLPMNYDSIEQRKITFPPEYGTFIDFVKLDSETSYINALHDSGVIEVYGTRMKIDTTMLYPILANANASPGFDSIYDPVAKKTIWSKGQAAPTPEGTKELLLLSTKRVFIYLKDINAQIDSPENKANTQSQLIYPVTMTSSSGDYIDSRTVKYESVKFTPRSTVLLTYAGVGVGVIAVGALLFIAFRAFMRTASPSISLNSIPVATVVSSPNKKPNAAKPNNKGATVAAP
jgi:hypothetical protein